MQAAESTAILISKAELKKEAIKVTIYIIQKLYTKKLT